MLRVPEPERIEKGSRIQGFEGLSIDKIKKFISSLESQTPRPLEPSILVFP
jgi:hypothetical protein